MELFKIFGTIALKNQEALDGMDATTDKAQSTSEKIGAAFSKIGDAAVVAGKVIATGLAAGAAAFGALMKTSIDGFAEYEQLAGGAAKIFDEMSQTEILTDAQNAYKDLGLSANQYLSVMNDVGATFAATMGDKAGYEAAKTGLKAISDYASGTGKNVDELSQKFTLITRSTSSYQSIADQFSGILPATSAGFLEQAQAAGILSDSYTTLTEVPIDEYQAAVSQMLEQGVADLGLANNTAAEAMTTISGSLSMAKSAWKNFITGIADENQDLDVLFGNLVDSIVAVADNLIPRIQILLPRLVEGLNQLITTLLPYIPPILETLLPGLIDGAVALLTGLISALPSVLGILLDQIPSILMQIGSALIEAFPVLLQTCQDLFGQIFNYVSLGLLNTGTSFDDFSAKAKEVFDSLWTEIQEVWNSIGQPIWDLIQDCIGIVRDKFSEVMPEIQEFVSSCFSDISDFWENNLKPCFEAIGNFIETVLAPAFEFVFSVVIGGVVDTVFNLIKDLWNNTLKPVFTGITDFLTGVFTGNWEQAWNGIKSILQGVWNLITKTVKNAMTNVKNTVINIFKPIVNKIKSVGSDMIEGLWNGISDKVDWIVEKVKGFSESVLGAIKGFFGIHSPSRVMRDEVGKMLAEGLAEGIEDNADVAEAAAEDMGKAVLQAAEKRLDEYTTYNKLTLADEVAFWDSVRQQCEAGTAARLDADKKYLSAKEKLNEQLVAAEKEYQDVIAETQKKIEDRMASILNSFGLFKEYISGDEVEGETLIGNLQSQVGALEEWQGALGTLEERIGGTSLFDTIQAMGVDALEEVRAINQMTDEELAAYADLYAKRAELARQIAEDELAEENAKAVQDAYQVYMETCNELGVSIIETTADMSENVAASFDGIATAVSVSMSNVGSAVNEHMTKAASTIKEMLNAMKKSFADFNPHIAMPHFTISGKFGLDPTTVPTFDVEWYSKAMNNPMLMTDPTIFGYDAKSGNFLGGGEAGAEVVSGANTLMNMIQGAVSQQMGNMEMYLQRLIDILEDSFPQMIDAMDFDIVFNADAAAGAMAVPMNKALGKLSAKKGRGR